MTIPTITQSQWPEIYIALLSGNEADRALAEKIRPKEGPTRDEIQQKDIDALTMEDYGRMRLAVKRRLADVESAMTSMGVSAELGGIVKALAPARDASELIKLKDAGERPLLDLMGKIMRKRFEADVDRMLDKASAPSGSGARIELLTWREHGDDDDSLEVCVFGADDQTSAQDLVEEEQDGFFGLSDMEQVEREEYPDIDEETKDLVHTASVTIRDGEFLTTSGRHFRVTLTEVAGMCVTHTDVRCEFDGSGSVTCRKCLAEEKAERAAIEETCAERARIELGLKK